MARKKPPPKFVSPYHPRGDQAVIYETFGLNPTSLISGMVGPWDPYSYGTQPAANVLCQCIVEGRGQEFMAPGSELSKHKEPPVSACSTSGRPSPKTSTNAYPGAFIDAVGISLPSAWSAW